jgi:hypothetical protein
MGRFVEEQGRRQDSLLPASLDDYVYEDNPVRVVEAFMGELDFPTLGFAGKTPAQTGRPAYHPSTMLKIYLYGSPTPEEPSWSDFRALGESDCVFDIHAEVANDILDIGVTKQVL